MQKFQKADVLNEVLNEVVVSVMVNTTSSGTSQISQSNTIDASGVRMQMFLRIFKQISQKVKPKHDINNYTQMVIYNQNWKQN